MKYICICVYVHTSMYDMKCDEICTRAYIYMMYMCVCIHIWYVEHAGFMRYNLKKPLCFCTLLSLLVGITAIT